MVQVVFVLVERSYFVLFVAAGMAMLLFTGQLRGVNFLV
jgi:hypothetical protein